MITRLPTLDWRRTRAAAFACVCLALLARSADADAPVSTVNLCALQSAGAAAMAPAGWTLAVNGAGTDIRLRSADGAMGAEWGLAAVAGPPHGADAEQSVDDAARALLIRSLRAMGDEGALTNIGAHRAYAEYFTGCPFATPTHRGVVFYHQYQWDENQSVISYYVAWVDKDRWTDAGFVAANVALSIHAPAAPSPLNPFWVDGKQAEAETGLRQAAEAFNREERVVCLPSKTSGVARMLSQALHSAPTSNVAQN